MTVTAVARPYPHSARVPPPRRLRRRAIIASTKAASGNATSDTISGAGMRGWIRQASSTAAKNSSTQQTAALARLRDPAELSNWLALPAAVGTSVIGLPVGDVQMLRR